MVLLKVARILLADSHNLLLKAPQPLADGRGGLRLGGGICGRDGRLALIEEPQQLVSQVRELCWVLLVLDQLVQMSDSFVVRKIHGPPWAFCSVSPKP